MARTRLLPLLFIPALALASCEKPSNAQAKISGALTYKGQLIKAGTMALHTAEGQQYPATINDDGTYSATDLPPGELVVTVDTAHLDPKYTVKNKDPNFDRRMKQGQGQMSSPEAPASQPPPFIKLPSKYANAKTSPLSITLKNGRQVQDLDLQD